MVATMLRWSRTAVAAAGLFAGCAAITSIPSATSAQTAQTGSAAVAHASAIDASAASTTSGQLTLITEPQDGIAPVLSARRGRPARGRHGHVRGRATPRSNAALAADAHRGVAVRVLLNGGYYGQGFPQNQAAYDYLKAHGVPVRWTPSVLRAHPPEDAHRRRARLHPDLQPHARSTTPQAATSASSTPSPPTMRPSSRRSTPTGTASASPLRPAQTSSGVPALKAPRLGSSSQRPGGWTSTTRRWILPPSRARSKPTLSRGVERSRHHDRRLLVGRRVCAADRRRRARPHVRRRRRAVHPRQDDSHPEPRCSSAPRTSPPRR